jgi:hypothetical protein
VTGGNNRLNGSVTREGYVEEIRRTVSDSLAYYTWTECVEPCIAPQPTGYSPTHEEKSRISHATLYISLLALRKLDEFLSSAKSKYDDDLRWSNLALNRKSILGEHEFLLTREERSAIDKCVAHPTIYSWFGDKDEVQLATILNRTFAVLNRLKSDLDRVQA